MKAFIAIITTAVIGLSGIGVLGYQVHTLNQQVSMLTHQVSETSKTVQSQDATLAKQFEALLQKPAATTQNTITPVDFKCSGGAFTHEGMLGGSLATTPNEDIDLSCKIQ